MADLALQCQVLHASRKILLLAYCFGMEHGGKNWEKNGGQTQGVGNWKFDSYLRRRPYIDKG